MTGQEHPGRLLPPGLATDSVAEGKRTRRESPPAALAWAVQFRAIEGAANGLSYNCLSSLPSETQARLLPRRRLRRRAAMPEGIATRI